jgi:hypothetical protein
MAEHQARVRQIEGLLRQRIGDDIVFADFQVGARKVSIKRVSMSVASTWPVGPTHSASHFAIEPPPVPTSRHLQPGATPLASR